MIVFIDVAEAYGALIDRRHFYYREIEGGVLVGSEAGLPMCLSNARQVTNDDTKLH